MALGLAPGTRVMIDRDWLGHQWANKVFIVTAMVWNETLQDRDFRYRTPLTGPRTDLHDSEQPFLVPDDVLIILGPPAPIHDPEGLRTWLAS